MQILLYKYNNEFNFSMILFEYLDTENATNEANVGCSYLC